MPQQKLGFLSEYSAEISEICGKFSEEAAQ